MSVDQGRLHGPCVQIYTGMDQGIDNDGLESSKVEIFTAVSFLHT